MNRPFAVLKQFQTRKPSRRFGPRPQPLRCEATDPQGNACRKIIPARILGLKLCPEHFAERFPPHSAPSCEQRFPRVHHDSKVSSHAGCAA